MLLARRIGFVALIVLTACGDSKSDPERGSLSLVVEEGCQPLLAGTAIDETSRGPCLLPYPSDFYRTASGVKLSGKAKIQRAEGGNADIHDVVPMDGFSLIPTIVANLPSEVIRDGLPGILGDPTLSAKPESATLLVDAESGALLPHYVDKLDRGLDAKHEPIVMRTFAPLLPSHRYVVVLKGVRLTTSTADAPKLAPPPEGFRRLRDKENDPALDGAYRDRFERDVFGVIERLGSVKRAELQLAWDFTTGSAEEPRRDMLKARELTLQWLTTNVPKITNVVAKDGTDRIWRTVTATIEGPLFLDKPQAGGRLFRGADGVVAQNGLTTFDITVNVPNSVRDGTGPGRTIALGHGFFGGKTELEGNGAKTIATDLRAVQFGIDWWGMSKEDVGLVSNTLGDHPDHGSDFAERVHQAMMNWIVATAAIKGPIAQLPELMRISATGGPNELFYDPSFISYFGASQGHILGGTLAALNPDFSRAVLNVGGGGFTHLMPRSANFGPFSIVLDFTFKDELLTQAYIAMFQRAMDRIDPITYAPLVEREPLPSSPPDRRVLLQVGLGDPAVPNLGSWLHARALGAKQTMPAPFNVFGLEPATDSLQSAITVFDFGVDTTGYANPSPLPQNEVHEGVRVNAAAIREMDGFLRPNGTITHPCDGPCDPL